MKYQWFVMSWRGFLSMDRQTEKISWVADYRQAFRVHYERDAERIAAHFGGEAFHESVLEALFKELGLW